MALFTRGMAFRVWPADLRSFVLDYGGTGGLAVLFMPQTRTDNPLDGLPPALFDNPFFARVAPGIDLKRQIMRPQTMMDPAMDRLKSIFSRGWEEFRPLKDASFLIPGLKSMDFFENPASLFEEFFAAAPFSLFESLPDDGLLLAAASFPPDRLARLMHQLRKNQDEQVRRDSQ